MAPGEMSMAPMENPEQPAEPIPPPMKRSSSLTNIWSALRRSFGRGKPAKSPDTSTSSGSPAKNGRESHTADDLQGNVARPPSGSLGASYRPDLNATGASMHSIAGAGVTTGTLGRNTHPVKVHVVLLDGDDVAFDFDVRVHIRLINFIFAPSTQVVMSCACRFLSCT